jgi:hypothetical protein
MILDKIRIANKIVDLTGDMNMVELLFVIRKLLELIKYSDKELEIPVDNILKVFDEEFKMEKNNVEEEVEE